MFVHLVFFKFKDLGDREEAKRRLESMRGRIDVLRSVEVGIDVVGGKSSWDLVLDARFDDRAALDVYAVDPVHREVVSWLKTVISQKGTVDYQL